MTTSKINIIPFQDYHQADIDVLMMKISQEFTDSIFSPQSKTIKEVSLLHTDKYWVAVSNEKVIGTIGFTMLQTNAIALKRMFLSESYRGKGIATKLIGTVIKWAIDNDVKNIYLGTMNQFKAAQSFYKKQNFEEILQITLPIDFPVNPVDTIFFKKTIK